MGLAIKWAREHAGLSQLELGAMIGIYMKEPPISQQRISQWESGAMFHPYYLGAIAKSCRVEMSFFEV
jgi:transcriptional regulator with XRE-family HTH domain